MNRGLVLGCLLAGATWLLPQGAAAFSIPDGCSARTLAGLKSPDGGEAAQITFRNMYPRPVEVWWINGEGKDEPWGNAAGDVHGCAAREEETQ